MNQQRRGLEGLTITPLSRPLFPGTVADLIPLAPRGRAPRKVDHEQRLRDWAETQNSEFRDYVMDLLDLQERLQEAG